MRNFILAETKPQGVLNIPLSWAAMSGTLAGVTSLGSEVVLYGKIDWLPNGAQNVRFLAGFSRKRTFINVTFVFARQAPIRSRQLFIAYKQLPVCEMHVQRLHMQPCPCSRARLLSRIQYPTLPVCDSRISNEAVPRSAVRL